MRIVHSLGRYATIPDFERVHVTLASIAAVRAAADATPALDVPWGTVVVATIALLGSAATIVFTAMNVDRQLAATKRSQWWERFTWAAELVLARESKRDPEFGLRVLQSLLDDPEARREDNKLALDLVNHVAENGPKPKKWRRR